MVTLSKFKKFTGLIISILLVIVCITGCGEDKSSYVHGMPREQYVDTIGTIVENIYVPRSVDEFKNVANIAKDYFTPTMLAKFTGVSEDFGKETYTSTIVWKRKAFGDKEYQSNNSNKVYYEFEVVRNYKHYLVCLEFTLDENDMISNYRVFN